jgi:hypothetical protein
LSALSKKIDEITGNTGGEPDLYPYFKELLSKSVFGIGLLQVQIVVDTSMAKSRQRPDLTLYRADGAKALKTPDHAVAVFEVKKSDALAMSGKAIVKEKRGYVQSGTRWFFLADQEVVWRIDVSDRAAFKRALDARGPIPSTLLDTWSWADLKDPTTFLACFGVVSVDSLQLAEELKAFRAGTTPFATLDAGGEGNELFAATVRNASETIRVAVENILAKQGTTDLKAANVLIDEMEAIYGRPIYDWSNDRRPVEFASMFNAKAAATLTDEQVTNYDTRVERLLQGISETRYALRIETDLLPKYAERQGEKSASLLSTEKKSRQLVASLAYETASLMLSRMLTIRFCEDYGLFRVRYISNGGIEVFWRFAEHFDRPMQELLRQSYRHASSVFASIFDISLLDWAVGRDEAELSHALEHAAYVLSRWNFATVRGDILSGVYDQYLDVSQRRRLGEVYTRPEIARFMLNAAGWTPEKTLFDPACGTGTFLVEALGQRLEALKAAGAISVASVESVMSRLIGLDISSFSVTLAQIQVFWRLIDLLAGKTATEVREFARQILPSLKFYGGWTSLDTFGLPLGDAAAATAQSGLAFRIARAEAGRARALVPAGFERASRAEYDVVIMNPPYVRSERSGGTGGGSAYADVTYKNTDAAVFFIYRALKQWVKPGGSLAFIVPIGITEAAYAGRLRRVLGGYRIRLIADLEGLGKATFRGVKRATVIMVVEKVAGTPDDDVEVLQLDVSALENDVIDFGKAKRATVKRSDLDRKSYLPTVLASALDDDEDGDGVDDDAVPAPAPSPSTGAPLWLSAMRGEEGSGEAFLTKLSPGDPAALRSMAELPRLGEIVRLVYVKRTGGKISDVRDTLPATEAYLYRPEILFNYGVKMGSAAAMKRPGDIDCIPVYKGQNVFPQGITGAPMGQWSPTARRESTRYIYSYYDSLSYKNAFAIRKIAQLPTAVRVEKGVGFQDTVFQCELSEPFPLHLYLLSRVVQFYAARVLRSSVIEDFGATWSKRTLTLLPVPRDRSAAQLTALTEAGDAVLMADSDIADRYRAIDAVIAAGKAGAKSLEALIVDGSALVAGIDLNQVAEEGTPVAQLIEVGDDLRSTDFFFTVTVPDQQLRTFVKFTLDRRIEAKPEELLTRSDVLAIDVPSNLTDVVASIASLSDSDLTAVHCAALDKLDEVVAHLCGISPALRDHMMKAMKDDPILSKMRPMTAQRGLRIQPYSDHSDGERYD